MRKIGGYDRAEIKKTEPEEGLREINIPKLHVTETAGVETLFRKIHPSQITAV